MSGALERRVHHKAHDARSRQLFRQPLGLHIAEAVIYELRRPFLRPVALFDIFVRLEFPGAHKAADVLLFHMLSVPGQVLAVAQHNLAACGAIGRQAHLACKILAQVEDPAPLLRAVCVHGRKLLHHAYRLHLSRAQHAAGAAHQLGVLPAVCAVRALAPSRQLQPRVVPLAIADGIERDGPGRGFPACIAADAVLCTVGVCDIQLTQQLGHRTPACLTDVPRILGETVVPAVAQRHFTPGLPPAGAPLHHTRGNTTARRIW